MKTNPLRNFAITDLLTSINSSDTTLTLVSGGGSSLPDPTEGEYNVVVWNRSDYANPDNDPFREIFRVKSGAGDVKVIERPAIGNDFLDEGTHNVAQNHNITGKTYSVMQALTKSYIDAKQFEVYVTVGSKNANYIVDGVADDVQIQEAIDEANSAGKRVFLKYGNYDIANTINKKGCSIYGETMNGTVLKWSGDPSVAIMENTADNPFEIANITFDGIARANGVIGLQPNGVNCERPVLSRVKFFNLGVGLKTANGGYKFWDGTGYSVYFRYNAIGMESLEYQFTLFDPLFSYNTIGSQIGLNGNLHVTNGTYTLNGIDLYFAGSPENCSWSGVWFEESSTAVASCAGTDIYSKVLQFTGCRFHTQSATKLMGLEKIIGMVNFYGCVFRTKDLGGGSESSTDVVGGAYTTISYLGCTKMNLAGALTNYGDLDVPTRIKIDTIIEHTTDNGVQIEGITCKDSILYVPTLLVVDTITQRTLGHIEVTSPIYCDTFAEKTLDNGIQLEGVTCKDNNLYTPGFVCTNEITQYSAGYVAVNSILKVNVVSEYATDVGVTIEGVEIKDSGIKLVNAINEFSTDTTLGGNSDLAVPTEKAVKSYVDSAVGGENYWDRTSTTLFPHNTGDSLDLGAGTLNTASITTDGITEKTLNNGVVIEGITLKDSILYIPQYICTNELTHYSGSSLAINTILTVNTINEYGTNVGVTIESVLLKDNNVSTSTLLIGSDANFTDFPRAKTVSSQANTSYTYANYAGVIGESASDVSYEGCGVIGIGSSYSAFNGRGVVGIGRVGNTADTGKAIGVYGESILTHAGDSNIAIYANAQNGATNYAFYGEAGTIFNTGDYSTTTGNITSTTGVLSMGSDTDTVNTLGRVKIGYDGTNSDSAVFAHIDMFNANDYGLRQNANGDTILNCKTGRKLYFYVNTGQKISIDTAINITSGVTLQFTSGSTGTQNFGITRRTGTTNVGNILNIYAGGASSTGTNLAGGNLILSSGIATGDGGGYTALQGTPSGQGSGSGDRNPEELLRVGGTSATIKGISTNAGTNYWQLAGKVDAVTTLDTAKYLSVTVDGVAYKVALVTS